MTAVWLDTKQGNAKIGDPSVLTASPCVQQQPLFGGRQLFDSTVRD